MQEIMRIQGLGFLVNLNENLLYGCVSGRGDGWCVRRLHLSVEAQAPEFSGLYHFEVRTDIYRDRKLHESFPAKQPAGNILSISSQKSLDVNREQGEG